MRPFIEVAPKLNVFENTKNAQVSLYMYIYIYKTVHILFKLIYLFIGQLI